MAIPPATSHTNSLSSDEFLWAFAPPEDMKVAVNLSAAKDLQFRSGEAMQILRFF